MSMPWAFWIAARASSDLTPEAQQTLRVQAQWLQHYAQHTVTIEGHADEQKVARGAAMVAHLADRAAETRSRVALYNHGDWFGEPENQVRIIRALPGRDVGIVYNFHHGHEHIARFDALVKAIRPYLWVVNLNGMRPEGPKILPFGTGNHERPMLQTVLDSGFKVLFGALGHVDDADVEEILRGNLRGLGFTPR